MSSTVPYRNDTAHGSPLSRRFRGDDTGESPADCFLRLAEHVGRERGKALEQFVNLLDRGWIDVEAGLVRLSEEFGVLHGRGERLAQRLQAVGWNAGRTGERPAEQKLPE